MGRSATVSKGGKVTIPKELRNKYNIEEGDTLYFENDNGKIVIVRMRQEKFKEGNNG